MPNYDFECLHCGHKFEAFQNMSAEPLNKCPECGKKLKRLIGSGAGVIFKGKGFYATDYAKKSRQSPASPPKISCPNAKGCPGCPGH